MRVVYPITLDSPIYISDMNGQRRPTNSITNEDLKTNTHFFDAEGSRTKINGHDSSSKNNGKGTRLTNLSGIHQGDLMKVCPNCGSHKNQNNFSTQGRTTTMFRDQSNCRECRNK